MLRTAQSHHPLHHLYSVPLLGTHCHWILMTYRIDVFSRVWKHYTSTYEGQDLDPLGLNLGPTYSQSIQSFRSRPWCCCASFMSLVTDFPQARPSLTVNSLILLLSPFKATTRIRVVSLDLLSSMLYHCTSTSHDSLKRWRLKCCIRIGKKSLRDYSCTAHIFQSPN